MRTEGVQWLFKALTLDAQNCVRRLARGRRRVLRFREHRSAWFDLHGGYWKLAACPGGRWDGGREVNAVTLRSTFACHADDVTCTDNSDSRTARGSSPLAHFTSPWASVVRRSSVVWLDSVSTSPHQISPKSTSILAPRILFEQNNTAAMGHSFQQYPAIHRRPMFIAAFQRNIS